MKILKSTSYNCLSIWLTGEGGTVIKLLDQVLVLSGCHVGHPKAIVILFKTPLESNRN